MRAAAASFWIIALGLLFAAPAAGESAIDYSRDIKPILSDNCYACHGPDEEKVKAGLRLDRRDAAMAELRGGGRAIVPGRSAESLLIERVSAADEMDRMPPAATGKRLTPEQIELLKNWIDAGAEWKEHWAFEKPRRPELPPVSDATWPRNPIDHFILARLDAARLRPSFEADRITLIRRVTLDLTGLPPTVAEVDAFLADRSPDAYEKVVERLLASPHYGERMAQDWLDLARYGDTNGYHYDSDRSMWPYRDYVINAFNANKPFDRFTLEQIAGDLLPDATTETKIASGFNRNVTYNEEGGADPDEFLVKYAVDRASTTGTVFLGMSFGCAECHDHKYDPITQKDFYSFYAFFNNVPEDGAQGHDQPHPPILKLPTPEQEARLAELNAEMKKTKKAFAERPAQMAEQQVRWERATREQMPTSTLQDGLVLHYDFDAADPSRVVDVSGSYRHGVYTGQAVYERGRAGGAIKLDGKGVIDAGDIAGFERTDAFSAGCWTRYSGSGGALIARMDEKAEHRGWDIGLVGGRVWVHLVHGWPANAIKVTTKASFAANTWHHVFVTYDGSSKAAGVRVYVNGQPQEVEINSDTLTANIRAEVPLYVGQRHASFPYTGLIDEVRIYRRFLTAGEVQELATKGIIHSLLLVDAARRTPEQQQEIQQYFLTHHDPAYNRLRDRLAAMETERTQIEAQVPHTLVMAELPERRPAFVLVRGDFQDRGEQVQPDVPAIFGHLPPDAPRTRVTLAKWLTSPDNPLVARVTVNRFWQRFFGTGIVKTANDFGSQGEPPSHPELLDWLAAEFIASGWDVKHMVRLMVTSATYRQSSSVRDNDSQADPYNRLLYRAPRLRLQAEQIRDNALAISGLLNTAIGGPSVFPYQPEGYYGDKGRWEWETSKGADLYRRGLYTFWRRTTFYPSFQIFDAPSREMCTVERPRTNTPLQALVTLNDPAFFEAARVFGQRMMQHGGTDAASRIVFAFRTALAREPSPAETSVLTKIYERELARYSKDVDAARKLVSVGQAPRPEELPVPELAAWTMTANVLLNLDETITRE